MNKEELKNRLLAQQKEVVEDIQGSIKTYMTSADIDEDDTLDPEDFSHQTESGDLAKRLEVQLQQAEKDLQTLSHLDMTASAQVEGGALVELDHLCLFISVASLPLIFEGHKIHPISMHAPIYNSIKGKQVGDNIKLGHEQHPIKAIY